MKKVGPYDHTPKKPEPAQTLKYFETQEGLEALSHDPALQFGKRLTKAHLPPPKEVQPASAGELRSACVCLPQMNCHASGSMTAQSPIDSLPSLHVKPALHKGGQLRCLFWRYCLTCRQAASAWSVPCQLNSTL